MGDADAVLERVDGLVVDDQHEQAIDLLTDACRTGADPRFETRLTRLRHEAATPMAEDAAPGAPVATVAAPDIGPSGLPEVDVADLDGPTAHAAVHTHGALLIRGAIGANRIAALTHLIDTSVDNGGRPAAERDPGWFAPLQLDAPVAAALGEHRLGTVRKFAMDGGCVLLADAPRAMFELLELYEELGLRATISEYLGERPMMSANKCTLRKVGPDEVGGWHQDGAFLGRDVSAINIWVTLSHCGVDAPGLALVPKRLEEIVETGSHGAYFDWAVGDGKIDEVAADCGVIVPEFEPGDMVIFDQMNLHKTAVSPGMDKSRYAIEFWCFAPSAYPENQVPMVW